MTNREKNPPRKEGRSKPGVGWIVTGTIFSLMSLMYFSTSSGFVKGLRTYFWTSTTGTIDSSDLRMHSRSNGKTVSGSGTVSYSIEVNGRLIESTDEVFRRWDGNTAGKFEEWSQRFSDGRTATIYFNRSGETSLGHWPAAYSYQFGIQGITTLLMGLLFIYRGAKQTNKANKGRLATASPSPAT